MGSNSSAWACDERRRRVARAPSPLRPARGRGGRRPELTPERNDTSEQASIPGIALRVTGRTSPTGGTPTGGGGRNRGATGKNHAPTWASRKSPSGASRRGNRSTHIERSSSASSPASPSCVRERPGRTSSSTSSARGRPASAPTWSTNLLASPTRRAWTPTTPRTHRKL